ncbi:MAG: alginate lyase family protein [Gemmatimonadetes bacterium]|nr:alginate lyase family protein [Gemmatimonadota bacterium]MBT6149636.1 alginate lyase family protein [Gemmatimonadota bacterium]MBT7860277.1 alginate lyase family protein [Gemmatimonadota bacterium]
MGEGTGVSDIDSEQVPRVFLVDGTRLPQTRRRVIEVDEALEAADRQLLEDAEIAMAAGPFSVLAKKTVPPSGDVHDYLSHGPYWWPDPDRDDGLPYIRKDGEGNPDREKADSESLAGLISVVNTLALAYYFSDHERFADHAALLLRTWFIDPVTRMNPHLQFAQGIPGHCDGRGIGIIDTAQLPSLLDAIGLLEASSAWSNEDQQSMREWCTEYLSWLTTSDHGRDEASQPNNHGTWYDAQVLALAAFSGDEAMGKRVAGEVQQRLDSQFEADGSQPLELRRTKSLSYSTMNLLGFFDVADLSAHFGVDLWQHTGPDGQSLRQGVVFLIEHAIDSEWLHPQIEPFDQSRLIPLLRRANLAYGEQAFETRIGKVRDVDVAADRTQLLYPTPS